MAKFLTSSWILLGLGEFGPLRDPELWRRRLCAGKARSSSSEAILTGLCSELIASLSCGSDSLSEAWRAPALEGSPAPPRHLRSYFMKELRAAMAGGADTASEDMKGT